MSVTGFVPLADALSSDLAAARKEMTELAPVLAEALAQNAELRQRMQALAAQIKAENDGFRAAINLFAANTG